jgi:transposase-like protein
MKTEKPLTGDLWGKQGHASENAQSDEVPVDPHAIDPRSGPIAIGHVARPVPDIVRSRGNRATYEPEYADMVVEYGRQGMSIAIMAYMLGVSRPTLNKWRERYPDFDEAMEYALELAQGALEVEALANMGNSRFNTNLHRFVMANRFPADWQERSKTDLTLKRDPVDELLEVVGKSGKSFSRIADPNRSPLALDVEVKADVDENFEAEPEPLPDPDLKPD